MLFLDLSNANFQFGTEKLILKPYTIAKTLPTISKIKIIDKKKFAKIALNKNCKTFMIYITTLEVLIIISIYTLWAPQI